MHCQYCPAKTQAFDGSLCLTELLLNYEHTTSTRSVKFYHGAYSRRWRSDTCFRVSRVCTIDGLLPRPQIQHVRTAYGGRRGRVASRAAINFCLAFAQLTFRESLRDIETCLTHPPEALSRGLSRQGFAEHAGRCQPRPRLANLRRLRPGADSPCPAACMPASRSAWNCEQTVYALDSTTIDLCLSCSPGPSFAAARERSSCTR